MQVEDIFFWHADLEAIASIYFSVKWLYFPSKYISARFRKISKVLSQLQYEEISICVMIVSCY